LQNTTSASRFVSGAARAVNRMIFHPDINGRAESLPLKCHGENTELSKGVLSDLIRRFRLPPDLF
jgi:hypothetical protein